MVWGRREAFAYNAYCLIALVKALQAVARTLLIKYQFDVSKIAIC
jgi:hypothetical protein